VPLRILKRLLEYLFRYNDAVFSATNLSLADAFHDAIIFKTVTVY